MAQPTLAEIRMFGFNFAPRGYALAQGQLLAISQNTALFSLLGTTYGGNGTTTFGLPDFRSRAPVSQGSGPGLSSYVLGEEVGSEGVTVLTTEMPAHTHQMMGGTVTSAPTQQSGIPTAGAMITSTAPGPVYVNTASNLTPMAPQSLGPTGGSQSHNNIQPRLGINYAIATQGVYPARN